MNTMWLDEPPMYGMCNNNNNDLNNENRELIPDIIKWRRTRFVDVEKIYQLTRMKTYDIFGDVDPAKIFEYSCLSLVQINAINEVVANISLCNYPNIPSVPVNGWLEWISRHYGIHGITQRNTLFVHMLIWDTRYNDQFYKRILDAVFLTSNQTNNVIFIMPPFVTPVGFIEESMTRIVPNGQTDNYKIQALYISLRHMHCPRLKIRRVVEEDNDDIIPILNRESERFKELYGEFYISEMMRYPDGIRQMVVAEASDGLATGILCLNKIVDIQTLNEHFELAPYHGLQKYHLNADNIYNEKKISTTNATQVSKDILFPAQEMRNKDHFKVKTINKKNSESYSNKEILNDDLSNTEEEPECSCSDLGEYCNKVYPEAPCPSCNKIGSNNSDELRISLDYSTNDSESFTSVEKSLNNSQTFSKDKSNSILKVKIDKNDDDDDKEIKNNVENHKLDFAKDLGIKNFDKDQNNSFKKDVKIIIDEPFSMRDSSSGSIIKIDSANEFSKRLSITRNKNYVDDDSSVIEDVNVEINPRKMLKKEIKLPTYNGKINAFTLEIFSIREDIDERFSHDYLESIFECFPKQDYCVLLIPPDYQTFNLLQNFVRVPLRFNKDYPLVMYLAHRASIIGELKTIEADISDVTAIEDLLVDVPKKTQVLEDFKFSFDNNSPYISYVFLCEGTLVGLAILCVENEIDFVRSNYRIDDFICFDQFSIDSHARIIHMIIMPIFSSLHRYFLQELMNISDKKALYYRLYHKDASALTRTEPLVSFLGEMIPVLPRKKLIYYNKDETKSDDYFLINNNNNDINNNFALYMMIPRVASTPKIDVNLRIVVVGASDCGLSLLETLVFGPKSSTVNFTNITLISVDGIPFENLSDDVKNDEIHFGSRYTRDYRHLVGTRSWINVVHGTLTMINRKDKIVTVSNMGNLSYDYLILTCGIQYQRPKFTEELKAEKRGEFRDYPNPENCLTINNERDSANCFNYCKQVFEDNLSCSIVFYGQNIDSYYAIAMLIKHGISPENITLIKPVVKMCETRNKNFDGNDEIDDAVFKAIKESGVNFILDWDLVDWIIENNDNDDMFIKSLVLKQKGERRELECDVFFNYFEKTINLNTFLAICQSGLVFDGSLVIDPEFQTNDKFIFAAGTMTKYSRRFYADDSSHKYYNPLEIGERLGNKLRNIIDPKNSDQDISSIKITSKLDMTLPVFKKPVITYCELPGGFNYLNVRKPGKLLSNDDTNDVVLITGYPASSIGYFRIQLNQFDTVETITCLSKKEFEVENFVNLYGKHETLLNDLKIRFQKSMIPDLYAYFREPWAVAIFFDKFECLRVENRATLLSSTVVCGDTLVHDCTKALIKSKWEAIKQEDRELIETRYAGSVYQEELENSLIDFLQYNSESHLPMYCNPRFLRQFLCDIELIQDDPLFRK